MANSLTDLLASNADINKYFQSLPANVQNTVSSCGDDISSLEDLLRAVKGTCGNS